MKCTSSRCPVLFGNPKVHKDGFPLRPIISTTNSYNYNLTKYLTKLVEDTREKSKSYIKDSLSLAQMIQKRKVQKGEMMLSLDVDSLSTSVPVQDAIELAIKLIMKKNKETKNYTKLNSKDLRNLSRLAVCNIPFRF